MSRCAKILLVLILLASAVLLAYKLLPRVTDCVESADVAHTQLTLSQIMRGLQAFQKDFDQYPPSRFTDEPYDMKKYGGAGLLAYYLMGPKAGGWGGEDPQVLPFGGTSGVPVPAYFGFDPKVVIVAEDMRPMGFADSFQPPRKILYFLAEPGREPLFDVRDNPVDATCKTGFASQEQLEMEAKRKGPDGKVDWICKDYLLISPGPDRLYGPVVIDGKGRWRPAKPEEAANSQYDDITNFD